MKSVHTVGISAAYLPNLIAADGMFVCKNASMFYEISNMKSVCILLLRDLGTCGTEILMRESQFAVSK
jgi:hypothetical protein